MFRVQILWLYIFKKLGIILGHVSVYMTADSNML